MDSLLTNVRLIEQIHSSPLKSKQSFVDMRKLLLQVKKNADSLRKQFLVDSKSFRRKPKVAPAEKVPEPTQVSEDSDYEEPKPKPKPKKTRKTKPKDETHC